MENEIVWCAYVIYILMSHRRPQADVICVLLPAMLAVGFIDPLLTDKRES